MFSQSTGAIVGEFDKSISKGTIAELRECFPTLLIAERRHLGRDKAAESIDAAERERHAALLSVLNADLEARAVKDVRTRPLLTAIFETYGRS